MPVLTRQQKKQRDNEQMIKHCRVLLNQALNEETIKYYRVLLSQAINEQLIKYYRVLQNELINEETIKHCRVLLNQAIKHCQMDDAQYPADKWYDNYGRLLGCGKEDFKKCLCGQFPSGMSWDNYRQSLCGIVLDYTNLKPKWS